MEAIKDVVFEVAAYLGVCEESIFFCEAVVRGL